LKTSVCLATLPATAMGIAASTVGITAAEAAIGATPGPATDGEPRIPEGVPEDVLEESEEEPKVAPKPEPEVVRGHDHRPHGGGSSPIPWCTSTIFIITLHGRGLEGCHRRGNGGGPGASHPLRVG
jgi:hypothetical protein